jgi:hypothetical protein
MTADRLIVFRRPGLIDPIDDGAGSYQHRADVGRKPILPQATRMGIIGGQRERCPTKEEQE